MQKLLYALLYLLIVVMSACSLEETSTGPSISGSPPPAPTEITATTGNEQVTLQWKEAAEASSYNIYWSNTQGVSPATGTKMANVSNPYVHTGLTNGATYYYVITAVNGYGESGKSAEVAITLNNAPSAPTGVAATSGEGQAIISWNPVDKATTYNLYWSNTQGVSPATGTKIANVLSPYVHTGLTNGTTYYYVITAVNGYGESGKSAEIAITLNNAPSAPTGVVATSGEGQVRISWNPVDKATTYNLYWSNTQGVSPAKGTKIANVSSPYVHTGLTNGATYYYIITAVNAYGESGKSAEVAITLNNAPPAPTGVSVTSGDGQVGISWDPVEKATTYNIYWSNEPDVRIEGSTKIKDVTSPYSHKGLSNGSPYYYVVTAVNTYGESGISQEVYAIPHTDPDNARLRVVWVQDVGDGEDTFAAGGNLRLMGLDTADGAGERAILSTVGSYVRPLITPKGDRVVYSDRIRKKVFVVNWNGTGLREIVSGFAFAVWMDLRDGREWVYFGEENWGPDRDHTTAVYRMPLDGSGSRELVWNQTPVMVVGFQLSVDGRMASGNFPWPDGGVADLPNRGLRRYAKGCWASLSNSKKPFFWIFDGAHRNLTLVNPENEKKWQINISSAPGIRGHEVYHPRWSNDPRIMVMTGPYKVGSGANRIAGGGREVEIYIGRFNADFTAIESWWQATKNDRGDFFPDVWVAPSEGAKQKTAKVLGEKKTNEEKPVDGILSKKTKPGPVSAAPGKSALQKTIKRLVVEARLTDLSVIPTPQDIAPYRRALLVNGYNVVRVSGSYRQKKIMAAHWVIEEGQVLKDAIREKGKTYRMVLERYDDHPELEGERLIMDSDEFKLPLYYELRK